MLSPVEQRIGTLLERLARRSRQCPGLFLLEAPEEFQALAAREASNREALALVLEQFDRHPSTCHAAVNRWLLANGCPSLQPCGSAPAEYQATRKAIQSALQSACQSSRRSAA